MLKSFVDRLSNINIAINWLKRESPDDQIIFVSAATVIESGSIAPVKWYHQLSARGVILILTKNQVAFKKTLFSPLTVFYILIISLFLIIFIMGKQWSIFLLAFLAFLDFLLHLSYRRKIQYNDIRKIMLDAREGIKTELVIDTKEGVIHAFFAQTLPPKALNMITSRAKTVIPS
jgi:hypothetical protein